MATMNRNENLEEINTDALFGIPYLNYQTMLQKVVFWGSILVSIGITIMGSFFWKMGTGVLSIIILLPLGVGVLFGCNYNQDLSLIKYIMLKLTNKKTTYVSKPKEDIINNKQELSKSQKEKELAEMDLETAKKEQKKLLKKVLIVAVAAICCLIVLLIVISATKKDEPIHHEVSIEKTVFE